MITKGRKKPIICNDLISEMKKEWQQSNVFDKHADWTWDFYRYHAVRKTILGWIGSTKTVNHSVDRRDIWRIMQITMEEWNEIQHIGYDSNEHYWLLDLLSENSCYTLEWGIIKKENGEMSIYGKQWKYSLLSSQCWNLKLISFYVFSNRFEIILQTSLTIILRTVIVYCLVTARIRK